MAQKYRVNGLNGAYVEYKTLDEIPQGVTYEVIEIIEPTPEELAEQKRPLIEEIDKYYTNLIDTVLMKTMQKMARGVYTELPNDVLQRVEELVLECNDKISALGVDVSTYRETKREKIILKNTTTYEY